MRALYLGIVVAAVAGCTQTPGPVGPAGPMGPAGPAGPTGSEGPQGAAGPAAAYVVELADGGTLNADGGVIVVEGPQGPQGLTGQAGDPGLPGTSVTSSGLDAGDSNCAYGGSAFVSASGTSYACNGAPGTVDYSAVIANGTSPQNASFNVTGTGSVGSDLAVGGNAAIAGAVSAAAFAGDGSALTNLNASSLTGTVADARLSANVPRLGAPSNAFTGNASFNNLSFTGALTGNVVANAVTRAASDPICDATRQGTVYFNTQSQTLRICNGTVFITIGGQPVFTSTMSPMTTSIGPGAWTPIFRLNMTGPGVLQVLGQLTINCVTGTVVNLQVTINGTVLAYSAASGTGGWSTVPISGFGYGMQVADTIELAALVSGGGCNITGGGFSQLSATFLH